MKTRPLPEATQKRIIVAVQVLLVVVGAITVSIVIAGLLGFVVMDALAKLFLLGLGIAMILTGVFRANLIEFVV